MRVHDADRGPIRRFLGGGAPQLARTFELVHDQQRYLTLEVIDTAGRRAFSGSIRVYCYKSGLFRCGDNLNILGPTAMCWHPDRNQFFDAAKDFRNGSDFAIRGWDTSEAALGVPKPTTKLWDMMTLQEAGGEFPHISREQAISGRLMEVGVNNYDIQLATMRMEKLSEAFDNAVRPTPSMASPPRDVADIAYYTRTHTIFAPMERVNMFTVWNHRRDREGRQDYRGGIIWHEGEYRFKQDVTLKGSVPIPLVRMTCPTDVARNIGTAFVVTDAAAGTRVALAQDTARPARIEGRVKPGGYAAYLTTPVGYHGLLVPADVDLAYAASLPAESGCAVGLGRDGEVIKAGTVLKYRFGLATFAGGEPGNGLLEHTARTLNLGGGQAGYPVAMRVGQVADAVFFFTAQADGREAEFSLGPQKLILDLPIRVRGLVDNGCAAVYSQAQPWFRFVPVDAEGTAWLTAPIEREHALWVGNVFTCDHPAIKLTLVVDGQAQGKAPMIEVHNPTDAPVTARLNAAAHAPVFAGLRTDVTVPAGDSLWLMYRDGKLIPRGELR